MFLAQFLQVATPQEIQMLHSNEQFNDVDRASSDVLTVPFAVVIGVGSSDFGTVSCLPVTSLLFIIRMLGSAMNSVSCVMILDVAPLLRLPFAQVVHENARFSSGTCSLVVHRIRFQTSRSRLESSPLAI